MRRVGGRRLAVATAYEESVNLRLRAFLKEEGFEVLALKGLGIKDVAGVQNVTQAGLLKFSVRAFGVGKAPTRC